MVELQYRDPYTPVERIMYDAKGRVYLRCGPACDLARMEDGTVQCRCRA